MKMEVLAVQNQFQTQFGVLGSNKVKDWTTTLTAPPNTIADVAAANSTAVDMPYLQNSTTNKMKHSINKSKSSRSADVISGQKQRHHVANNNNNNSSSINNNNNTVANANTSTAAAAATVATTTTATAPGRYNSNLFVCDDFVADTSAVQDLAARLLDELRAAKSRHLSCTEVSLPCDLTTRIAADILRVSAKEPCGLRGCTIYIEFEDEPSNSRRIASLRCDAETVSTFEVYLTLRQDHRGWTALLPQFMKSLARTITISPVYTITKHKLYTAPSPLQRSSSISYARAPLALPTS